MKIFILIAFSFLGLFAQSELDFIENSYKEASKNFKLQKNEYNITKLLGITKVLYENNKKLKELKAKYTKKLTVELVSKKPLDNLQVDDIVELHVKTSHNTSKEYAKSDLSFFIYDGDTLLAKKDVELYEKGGIHKESLKFQITEPSEKYKICATFKEDNKEYKECESFGVVQLIVAKPIIASTSLGATSSDKVLFPNREFFLYMPFENKSDITLEGKIEITDNGNVILEEDFKKEPSVGFKKAGILVPPSLLNEKQNLNVKISLKGEGINPIEKEENIYISAYKWSVSFPSSLDKNEVRNFEITAPTSFMKPLHVDVSPHGGIVVAHNSGNLKGRVVGASHIKETANIRVTIKDAKGEKVQRSIVIALNPNFVEQKVIKTATVASKKQFIVKHGDEKYVFNTCCKGKTRLKKEDYKSHYEFEIPTEIYKYFKNHIINDLTVYNYKGVKSNYYKFNNGKLTSAYTYFDSGKVIGKINNKFIVNNSYSTYTNYDFTKKRHHYKFSVTTYKQNGFKETRYRSNGTIKSVCKYDKNGAEIKCTKF